MSWLICAILVVTANFLLYTLALRHVRAFGDERIIFLYQFGSFVLLPFILIIAAPPVGNPCAALTAALALHAIYSMSFLELWSLSEGSYSLRMLDRVERLGILPADADISDLEKIGTSKKTNRLGSLLALQLIRAEGHQYRLTLFGRIAAGILRLFVRVANVRGKIG